ncbi:glycosyltransferase family 2 protein [Terrisporobacter glycolicus]|nr:glycosyltransferase family 2 protein [Terrisporobacter glycolicus]
MKLTIFTPTYNRAYCLTNCYESLLRQYNKNFEWLIIDDGSSDNTESLVNSWLSKNNGFQIKYIYKQNGGLHTAYNEAIAHISTELSMCVDSDDYIPDNCINDILNFWDRHKSNKYAGIVGLDSYTDGSIIGDLLPDQKYINLIDLLTNKYNLNNGDRKLVVRTDLYKSVFPMKSFKGEKNFNPHYMHLLISKEYDFLVLNKVLCIVEYQENGMSNNIINQYYNSPKSFAEIRKLYLSFPDTPIKFKFRHMIHYVSSSILSKIFICIKI